jgi:hypothetical protein
MGKRLGSGMPEFDGCVGSGVCACVDTCLWAQVCVPVWTHVCGLRCVCQCGHMSVHDSCKLCVSMPMYTDIHKNLYIYIYIYIYADVALDVYVYVYIHNTCGHTCL